MKNPVRSKALRVTRLVSGAALAALMLAGCAAQQPAAPAPAQEEKPIADGPRVAVAYAGGVLVLDGATLEVIDDLPSEEFVRVNPAGDDRHVVVTTSEGFQFLDMRAAALTDLIVPAEGAGHVVRHAGRTVLYDDATSDTTIFESVDLAKMTDALPKSEVIAGVTAHHGVSVVLEDGTLLTTVGDEKTRSGVRATDDHGHEMAVSAECPSVHGEGAAANEAVVFGCENGALLYVDGEFTKLVSPDAYGRIGNAYTSEDSPFIVMDYKNDPDAEGYLLSNIALIDTQAKTLKTVALPEGVTYTWRGVVRGPSGEALMLASDGRLHVIDPASGEITDSYEAIKAWESPAQWQEPHPAVAISGHVIYVTDAAERTIVALDTKTGEQIATGKLPQVPNEIAVVD